jgi:hypothetical protein
MEAIRGVIRGAIKVCSLCVTGRPSAISIRGDQHAINETDRASLAAQERSRTRAVPGVSAP